MDNEKLIKQLSEEGKNVPDNRKRIINAAKAEGLLTDNSPKPSAVYNGSRTAAAVKGNRVIAAIASVFVLGTVAAAAIVPFVAGNNGGGNTPVPPGPLGPSIPPIQIPSGPILCEEKLGTDYAIGAVSTAKLLGCFGIADKEDNGATAVAASAKREALVGRAPDAETQINNFGTYFGAFGTFFGEDEDIVKVSESSVKFEKYPNSIVIAGKYANGEDAEFAMYYLEALDVEKSTDDEDIYYLEGAIFIDKVYYYLEGERTFLSAGGTDAYDLVLRAYPNAENKGDYVQMTMGYREVNDSYVKSYDYKVFKDGDWLSQTLTYLPSFNGNEAFNLYCGYGDSEARFTVERPEANQPILRVGYEMGTMRSSFKVSQTKSAAVSVLMNNYIYDFNEANKTCSIRGYKASETLPDATLDIPGEVVIKNDVYTVTAIGGSAFAKRTEIKKLVIHPNVKSIGLSAFTDCTNLEEVEFNEGLENLQSAFYNCKALKSIAIPASVTFISDSTFHMCSGLESISVAAGNTNYFGKGNCLVTKSGSLIQGCANSVIPDDGSVKTITDYSFCRTNVKSVNIPESVKLIEAFAFEYCNELEEVVITKNVTELEMYAFGYCEKLGKVTLPDTDIKIMEGVFHNTGYVENRANWSIENGYEALYIGKHLIYLNTTSTDFGADIVLKTGTLTIANKAFRYNQFGYDEYLIGSITLNTELLRIGSITHIGGNGCLRISFAGDNEYNVNGLYRVEGNCLIDTSENSIIAGCDGSVIPSSVTKIDAYAFANCKFENIDIPDNIRSIGMYAFAGCINLWGITIPGYVSDIGGEAFFNCRNLRSVLFDDPYDGVSLTIRNCFTYCDSLEEVNLPRRLIDLGMAFDRCMNLTSITIQENYPFLRVSCVAGNCEKLERIIFTGTSEGWKECYMDDIDFMAFEVFCQGDGVLLKPDYHM